MNKWNADPSKTHSLADATDAWISVVRAYQQCTATLAHKLEPYGVSVLQHEVLMNLRRTPGLTQQHLSERCFSAKSGISMIVAKMVKDGIVVRARSERDHRAWNLSLTAQGDALAAKIQVVQDEVVQAMAASYSEQDLKLMKDRMDHSAEALLAMRIGDAGQM
ncbi:putative transcription regulator protein [Sulfitobacter noctilucicola]|uniref:DNA-binding MarR family transcriptional regulator n=1 Tax=Sulfitobacter noctilucicola TaxID=1342301 RepID=A0A7W6Q4Z7_9RHOB|nr:MarR family transcriptional regulator [Sulfitobacter noctilucicola]KIN63288.1 putative transcription regulator protein [Sulfitobacter noctilucicola]MBB4175193.1 DNA-binding MarR family transcriptional regulator [Sulfitobacter noctilucicola]